MYVFLDAEQFAHLVLLYAVLQEVHGQAAQEAARDSKELHHTCGDGHRAPAPVVGDDVWVVVQRQHLRIRTSRLMASRMVVQHTTAMLARVATFDPWLPWLLNQIKHPS